MKENHINNMTIEQIDKKLEVIEDEHGNCTLGCHNIAGLMRCVRGQQKRNQFFRELMKRGEEFDESEHGSFDLESIGDNRQEVRAIEPLPDPFYRDARDKALSDAENVIQEYRELKVRFDGYLGEDIGEQMVDIDRMTNTQIGKKLDAIDEKYNIFTSDGFVIAGLLRQVHAQRENNKYFRTVIERGDIYDSSEDGEFHLEYDFGAARQKVRGIEPPPDSFYKNARSKALADADAVIKEYKELKQQFKEFVGEQEKRREEEQRQERETELKAREVEYPAARGSTWDDIDRKHATVREGFLYVLTNPSMPGLVKIGFTTQSPTRRADQLSNDTGVPMPFEVAHYWRVEDPYVVEQLIHHDLDEYNINKEFFRMSAEEAKGLIELRVTAEKPKDL